MQFFLQITFIVILCFYSAGSIEHETQEMSEESTKRTEDPAFQAGVMSPNSKRTFSG